MALEQDKTKRNTEESLTDDTAGKSRSPRDGGAAAQLPKIDFSMFIFSLNSSVLVNLGVIDDPATGHKAQNIPAAKQTIDILSMLQEKTRGNLSHDEAEMLKHMLYDLKMIYVRLAG